MTNYPTFILIFWSSILTPITRFLSSLTAIYTKPMNVLHCNLVHCFFLGTRHLLRNGFEHCSCLLKAENGERANQISPIPVSSRTRGLFLSV